jgi:hypothetical protein
MQILGRNIGKNSDSLSSLTFWNPFIFIYLFFKVYLIKYILEHFYNVMNPHSDRVEKSILSSVSNEIINVNFDYHVVNM